MGNTWTRTFDRQVFDIVLLPSTGQLFASLGYATDTVYSSKDAGQTWQVYSTGLNWGKYIPFYTRLNFQLALNNPVLFLVALLVNPNNASDTFSSIYSAEVNVVDVWNLVPGQPVSLDQDAMPKDKAVVLADPQQGNIIYVAGNADGPCPEPDEFCVLVYRIDWVNGIWQIMTGSGDTVDGYQPHPDCRDLKWDNSTGSLLLTNDGGIQVRLNPRSNQGKWISACGDIGEMEVISVGYDNRLNRWVAGAQDNDVQFLIPNQGLQSIGYLGCDGTKVLIDNAHCPARMYGSCQLLEGFTLWTGNPLQSYSIPIADTYFPDIRGFPYFVSAVNLNTQNPNQIIFPVNGSSGVPSAFYQVLVPDSLSNPIPPPTLLFTLPDNAAIYDFVAGGYTNNQSNPNFIYAINNTHFFNYMNNQLTVTPLPSVFADPVHFIQFLNDGTIPILGPISHGRTASIAVSPADSNIIAITGWPVNLNNGQEFVWLSTNGGRTWSEITGNLYSATGTISKIRPLAITIIEFSDLGFNAILVGTLNGVYLSWTDSKMIGLWSRLGTNDFPLVVVSGITYEWYSDTLAIASFGRGIYTLPSAKSILLTNRAQQIAGNCQATNTYPVTSSARFFPSQQSC